ncbi:MAG: KamA family radical SAM protein [Akkermansiaceae bacterium]|nr:KamA family radical SAM protein [Akkermansia sp.]MCD7798664.1 KamA family radical SAM protein [Akkermansiaceae bacterium]
MDTSGILDRIPSAIRQKATAEQWNDYAWQLSHSFTTVDQLENVLDLSDEERHAFDLASHRLALRITPYFLSLVDAHDRSDPLRLQVIPRMGEMVVGAEEMEDPCGEDRDMVVPGLVHRYPDRVLLLCTNHCAGYCRYCTRSRMVSGAGGRRLRTDWKRAFQYIREHGEVRDVLLSGGDPLLLPDARLDSILTELQGIPHVEFLRVGSRVPIFLPQRVTEALCAMLRRHAPLFLSVHVNHPRELAPEAEAALARLADHGLPVGSQSVLLRGINDTLEIQRTLYHRLLRCRVRPYYLYQCDLIRGSRHFRTTIDTGLDIMRRLRGFTSGYALPQYVVDAPGGGGKVPLNPEYITARDEKTIRLINFSGRSYIYPNESFDSSFR